MDGIRAVAVAAVIVYHLGYSRAPGGYVGVEVFFVLSGWLVTALLMSERRQSGRINLKAFWLRRARRLLPAVGALITITLLVAAVRNYDQLRTLRLDASAALAYILNWRYIIDQQSYFESALGPSALQHLWSLSIEEQFYLLLPLLLMLGLALSRTRNRMGRVALGLAATATVWRFVQLPADGDPSRAYYGTDTRAAALLAGVALGLVWVPERLRHQPPRSARVLFDLAGATALAMIVWYTVMVTEQDPGALRWPLTAVQIASLVLIAVAVHPMSTHVSRILSAAPLQWIGKRSYGIYLWHFPIIVAFSRYPGEQPDALPRVALMVGLTLIAAQVSYEYLEQPVRQLGFRGAVANALNPLRAKVAAHPVSRRVTFAAATLAVVTLAATGYEAALSPSASPEVASSAAQGESTDVRVDSSGRTPPAEAGTPATPVTTAPAPPPAAPALPAVTFLGDSIMVGAAPALQARIPNVVIDAEVSRQAADAPSHLQRLANEGRLLDVVVIHLGANGPYSGHGLDELIRIAGDRKVVLVNAKVPRRWEQEVNDIVATADAQYDNVSVCDWHSAAAREPALLRDDGYHLSEGGAERYADLIFRTITG